MDLRKNILKKVLSFWEFRVWSNLLFTTTPYHQLGCLTFRIKRTIINFYSCCSHHISILYVKNWIWTIFSRLFPTTSAYIKCNQLLLAPFRGSIRTLNGAIPQQNSGVNLYPGFEFPWDAYTFWIIKKSSNVFLFTKNNDSFCSLRHDFEWYKLL